MTHLATLFGRHWRIYKASDDLLILEPDNSPGAVLRHWRKRRRMTFKQAATMLGTTAGALCEMEHGDRSIPAPIPRMIGETKEEER